MTTSTRGGEGGGGGGGEGGREEGGGGRGGGGSGDGVWLTDVDGNRLLDAYNNVPQVGHAHPRVTAALASQAKRLTTNTRYLVDDVAVYADRLTALLPDELSVVMFVNSGARPTMPRSRSPAPSRATAASSSPSTPTTARRPTAALSPEELGPKALESWVARIGGASTLGAPDAAVRVDGEVDDAVARLRSRGHDPALLVYDDVFASDGIFEVPPGYLRAAYERACGRSSLSRR